MASYTDRKNTLTSFQKFCTKVIRCGPVPRHIALILDGNRRYARENDLEVSTTYKKGFDKMLNMVFWCLQLGIGELTAYAFSIDNFNRHPQEVQILMQLFVDEMRQLLENMADLHELGIRVRVVGNISKLPPVLQQLSAQVMLATQKNDKLVWNLAMAYTSRDEIAHAMETVAEGASEGVLDVEDIDIDTFSECLYTGNSGPDILVRTSGEVRLSDFMTWQVAAGEIMFQEVLWPVFSYWNLLFCVFRFQRNVKYREDFCQRQMAERAMVDKSKTLKFSEYLQMRRNNNLQRLSQQLPQLCTT